jgi:hypothetical protein
MVEEVEGPMLGEGLPEEKLRTPTSMVNEWNGRGCPSSCPGSPYIEFRAKAHTKRRFS